MKLIIGLGNPGKKYENTRHNIGFDMIDFYVQERQLGNFHEKDKGLYLKARLFEEDVIFLKPQSFMNLSGEVVRKYVDYYKINPSDILVISDDLDLSVGNFKLKASGSSGGHNGLKNIELHLGTDHYKRLKIGISKVEKCDTIDYVLGRVSVKEREIYQSVFKECVFILDDFFHKDFSILMNDYNRKNR